MEAKALVAMSGGVDSSVAAYLVKEAGHEPVAVTMRLFDAGDICADGEGGGEKSCCSLKDVEDARGVAEHLDIPFFVYNLRDEFKEQVIARFVDGYLSGNTPNPCIDCNRYLKFSALLGRARQLGMEHIVTGHYARIEEDENSGRYLLKKALDHTKDQSYVLYNMTQDVLRQTIFPLGELSKDEIRKIAATRGFGNAKKPDSQDICFVPGGDYAAFIEHYRGEAAMEGDFIDLSGAILGRHRGLIRYTIGQRKGLGLALSDPLYVHSKNATENTVILSEEKDLYARTLEAADFNWIAHEKPPASIRIKAKLRYAQSEQWAVAEAGPDGRVQLTFDEPQRAITPGQAVVLYDGEVVVGGGRIFMPKTTATLTPSS